MNIYIYFDQLFFKTSIHMTYGALKRKLGENFELSLHYVKMVLYCKLKFRFLLKIDLVTVFKFIQDI